MVVRTLRFGLFAVLALLVLGSALAALAAGSSSSAPTRQNGPFLLVSLPALGTVTWTCAPTRAAPYRLGFNAFRESATDEVRFHVGPRTIERRTVQPGDRVNFLWERSRLQQLDIVQGIKPGTLRAFVKVRFRARFEHCASCMPPRLEVLVLPR